MAIPAMVCSRGKSLTHRIHQMKLFNAMASTTVIGISFVNIASAKASVEIDLFGGSVTAINDGNPYICTVQGTRTYKSGNQRAAYPVKRRGPGSKQTLKLPKILHQTYAKAVLETDAAGLTYRKSMN